MKKNQEADGSKNWNPEHEAVEFAARGKWGYSLIMFDDKLQNRTERNQQDGKGRNEFDLTT